MKTPSKRAVPYGKLQTRLAEWDDLAQQSQLASNRGSSWVKYSAAIGSAMALATSAEAGIIYTAGPVSTPLQTHAAPGNGQATVPIDGASFKLVNEVFGSASDNNHGANGLASLKQGANVKFATWGRFSNLLTNFAPNAPIGASIISKFQTRGLIGINYTGNNIGFFGPQGAGNAYNNATAGVFDGYAGLQITKSGQEYYGWVKLAVKYGPEIDQVTALGWAYNDVAGQTILAGEMPSAPIPEPSQVGIPLLALGAAGVMAWRRRRNAPQAA